MNLYLSWTLPDIWHRGGPKSIMRVGAVAQIIPRVPSTAGRPYFHFRAAAPNAITEHFPHIAPFNAGPAVVVVACCTHYGAGCHNHALAGGWRDTGRHDFRGCRDL